MQVTPAAPGFVPALAGRIVRFPPRPQAGASSRRRGDGTSGADASDRL